MDALTRMIQEPLHRTRQGATPALLGCLEDQCLLVSAEGMLQRIPASSLASAPPSALAALIDHTLLKATATSRDIARLCAEARIHGFASVCVNPIWVSQACESLKGCSVRVCTVVGFPLGAIPSETKAFEADLALRQGAREVDMVLDLGSAKGGNWAQVILDIRAVRAAAPKEAALLKVILETCYLDEAEIQAACKACMEAGADFVKTSTGFGPGGATEAHVALMRRTVGPDIGVKASGRIRSHEDALRMVQAGATRLGVSSSLQIIGAEAPEASQGY